MIKKYSLLFLSGWKGFYENINYFISFVLLSFVYIFGLGLSCVVVKFFKIKLIENSNKKSSWRTAMKNKDNNFYKQF